MYIFVLCVFYSYFHKGDLIAMKWYF